MVWYNNVVRYIYDQFISEEFQLMGIFEIISAIVLILACVFIVIIVLMKDTKTQMSQTISGSSSDSFYQKNAGRTKEAMLNKATIASAVVFFVLALAVNIINVYFGGNKTDSDTSSAQTSSSVTETKDGAAETLEEIVIETNATADAGSATSESVSSAAAE